VAKIEGMKAELGEDIDLDKLIRELKESRSNQEECDSKLREIEQKRAAELRVVNNSKDAAVSRGNGVLAFVRYMVTQVKQLQGNDGVDLLVKFTDFSFAEGKEAARLEKLVADPLLHRHWYDKMDLQGPQGAMASLNENQRKHKMEELEELTKRRMQRDTERLQLANSNYVSNDVIKEICNGFSVPFEKVGELSARTKMS